MTLLLKHGADLHAEDVHGMTPLEVAAFFGQIESARVLVSIGSVVTDVAVVAAIRESNTELVELLLDAGGSPKATRPGVSNPYWPGVMSSPSSALHLASERGLDRVVSRLIAAGADLEWSNVYGTPLHAAIRYGHLGVARRLLEAGANVDAVAVGGATPLHIAARCGGGDCYAGDVDAALAAALLLKHGATVDATTITDDTPLFEIAGATSVPAKERLAMARALLDAGANPNHSGGVWTVAESAMYMGNCGVAQLVIEYGGRPKLPLNSIVYTSHEEILPGALSRGSFREIERFELVAVDGQPVPKVDRIDVPCGWHELEVTYTRSRVTELEYKQFDSRGRTQRIPIDFGQPTQFISSGGAQKLEVELEKGRRYRVHGRSNDSDGTWIPLLSRD